MADGSKKILSQETELFKKRTDSTHATAEQRGVFQTEKIKNSVDFILIYDIIVLER